MASLVNRAEPNSPSGEAMPRAPDFEFVPLPDQNSTHVVVVDRGSLAPEGRPFWIFEVPVGAVSAALPTHPLVSSGLHPDALHEWMVLDSTGREVALVDVLRALELARGDTSNAVHLAGAPLRLTVSATLGFTTDSE